MKLIFRYLRSRVGRVILGVSVKFSGTVVELLLPYLLSHVIDVVTPTGDFGAVLGWGFVMLLCALGAWAGNVLANRMAAAVSRDTTEQIRHDLFVRTSYLSNRQVDRLTIPSLISRMTSDTYTLHRTIGMIQRMGIRAPILLIGGVAVTVTLDPVLAAVLVAMMPPMFCIALLVSRKSLPMFTKLQETFDELVRVVRENATGVRVVKALSKTAYEKERFDRINRQVIREENRSGMTTAITQPTMNFLLNLGLVLVVVVGARRVNSGLTTPGDILAFLSYITIILNAILSMTRIVNMLAKAEASAERVDEVLRQPFEMQPLPAGEDTGAGCKTGSTAETAPHLVFDRVSFSYNKKQENLDCVDFALKRGQSLGIIGPTGAGKSTVAQLMLRFYDVDRGSIRIDGRDIRTMELEELRQKFGVVFQNDVIFRNTIGENVRIGRTIDLETIQKATEYAQASAFVQEAGGLDAPLEAKGANISGGQKQRLLIARALAGRPEILILDDSSSALDYKTDSNLRRELREHFADTTSVIIAQRVSSVRRCDQILVLEDGQVMGLGTHEQLMESCAMYREIAELQMGEGAPEDE